MTKACDNLSGTTLISVCLPLFKVVAMVEFMQDVFKCPGQNQMYWSEEENGIGEFAKDRKSDKAIFCPSHKETHIDTAISHIQYAASDLSPGGPVMGCLLGHSVMTLINFIFCFHHLCTLGSKMSPGTRAWENSGRWILREDMVYTAVTVSQSGGCRATDLQVIFERLYFCKSLVGRVTKEEKFGRK